MFSGILKNVSENIGQLVNTVLDQVFFSDVGPADLCAFSYLRVICGFKPEGIFIRVNLSLWWC